MIFGTKLNAPLTPFLSPLGGERVFGERFHKIIEYVVCFEEVV